MSGLTQGALAVVLGGALAAGVLLMGSRVPRWAAPTLSRRIAPYLREVTDPRGLTPIEAPLLRARTRAGWARLLGALGGSAELALRLRRAGWDVSASQFRARQLIWGMTGAGFGAAAAVVLTVLGRPAPVAMMLAPVVGVAVVVLCDAWLTAAVRRRRARVQDELPTVLEFLALCLSAGEGLRDALRRVGDVGSGELTGELRRAVLASGTGSSLADALHAVSVALDVPTLSRTVDHLVAAIERGAPLAQVLHDQAADAREEAKRALIEQAGRREILMLLPLVFLLLPLSVVFAVLPGVFLLRLGSG